MTSCSAPTKPNVKMKTAFVLLAAVVAFVSAHRGNSTPEERACRDVLKPSEDKDAMKANVETCIAEQDGLQAIIDGLKPERDGERPEGGRGPGGGRRPGGGRPGGSRGGRHGGHGGNPIHLLEENGNTEEATALKTCLARLNGHLTSDGSFDVTAFQEELTTNVAGTDQETNVQLGIDNCPTDALTNFDVHEYMKCVMAYCATGAAPTE
ncbi:hypothetical protein FHG87_005905 [Trinorchestia longiramus]|nr:hypothetical protein FHG87_005905 [Trinorchestia longiramus]